MKNVNQEQLEVGGEEGRLLEAELRSEEVPQARAFPRPVPLTLQGKVGTKVMAVCKRNAVIWALTIFGAS